MVRPALLFDLDGTLLDTDPVHLKIFVEMFAERGRDIDKAFYLHQIHGRLNADMFSEHFPNEDAQALSDQKEATFRTRLGSDFPAMAGAPAFIRQARRGGWATAVVTNAPRANAEAMLAAIGLGEEFDTVVIGDECARGKPHPDPYSTAIVRLGSSPDRAIAFEDSPSGLASARAAGAFVIGVRSSLDDADLRAAGAQETIGDFTDPALPGFLDRLTGARS
ncbi:MAG: HAD family phosphatase [Rhodobacteraceae bacterium]|nr:HAD family phosphatase [Paracoccaceae bacterium]